MGFQHWVLLGVLLAFATVVIGGFVAMMRALRDDEAIDAATFLALRELRERFEQTRKWLGAPHAQRGR